MIRLMRLVLSSLYYVSELCSIVCLHFAGHFIILLCTALVSTGVKLSVFLFSFLSIANFPYGGCIKTSHPTCRCFYVRRRPRSAVVRMESVGQFRPFHVKGPVVDSRDPNWASAARNQSRNHS